MEQQVTRDIRTPHWARSYFWDRGITQRQLATGLSIHPSALSLILKGEVDCPPRVEGYLQNQRALLEELAKQDGKVTDSK